jgi:hypothetical protein
LISQEFSENYGASGDTELFNKVPIYKGLMAVDKLILRQKP